MTFDWVFEPLRSDLEKKYGREQAKQIFANEPSILFENVTILNDEELQMMHLYQKYEAANDFKELKS